MPKTKRKPPRNDPSQTASDEVISVAEMRRILWETTTKINSTEKWKGDEGAFHIFEKEGGAESSNDFYIVYPRKLTVDKDSQETRKQLNGAKRDWRSKLVKEIKNFPNIRFKLAEEVDLIRKNSKKKEIFVERVIIKVRASDTSSLAVLRRRVGKTLNVTDKQPK
ncbi:hypothetical protein HK097_002188, partial [Rhizophlyctis rosea]